MPPDEGPGHDRVQIVESKRAEGLGGDGGETLGRLNLVVRVSKESHTMRDQIEPSESSLWRPCEDGLVRSRLLQKIGQKLNRDRGARGGSGLSDLLQ